MFSWYIQHLITNLICFLLPAYYTYKSIKNKDRQRKEFFLKYWVIIAFFSYYELFFDIFISWIPFYFELKLAFLIYIVLPQSKGSIVVFNQYLKPFLKKREESIDNFISSIIQFIVDRLGPFKFGIFSEDSSRASEVSMQEESNVNNDSSEDEILSSPKIRRRGSKKLGLQKNSPVKNLKAGISTIAKHLAM